MKNKDKILKISKKLGLTHIGSCLSVLPILEEIYSKKKPEDLVILDNAHAHLAHLMFTNPDNAEELIEEFGIHCDRRAGCDATGGSLGHGIGIGIGYILANSNRYIHVIVSDGSIMEGSNWEAMRIISELKLFNLKIHFNFNGYTAVAEINTGRIIDRINKFDINRCFHMTENGEGFEGVQGHYKKL